MADHLSAGRALSLRLVAFAAYVAGFYALVALGLPALAAVGVCIGTGIAILFGILALREGSDVFNAAINAAIMGTLTCGLVPFAVVNEVREPPTSSVWRQRLFVFSIAEAVFYIAVLRGTEPALAIGVGVAALLFQFLTGLHLKKF